MRLRIAILSHWLDPHLREEDVHKNLSKLTEQTHLPDAYRLFHHKDLRNTVWRSGKTRCAWGTKPFTMRGRLVVDQFTSNVVIGGEDDFQLDDLFTATNAFGESDSDKVISYATMEALFGL